jgi:hypothetical protein
MTRSYQESAAVFAREAEKQEAFAQKMRADGQISLAKEYEHQAGNNRRLERDAYELARGK